MSKRKATYIFKNAKDIRHKLKDNKLATMALLGCI